MDSTFSTSADNILRNAELRTELEPFSDESLTRVNTSEWSLEQENKYLAAMLQWEKAPVLPIYQWFEPDELSLPSPQAAPDEVLPDLISSLVQKLYEKHIVLDYTDHLSDRDLYQVIVYSILPQKLKKLDSVDFYRHWDCSRVDESSDALEDARTWLTYYASDRQRESWKMIYGDRVPEKQIPRYHRDFPKDDSVHY